MKTAIGIDASTSSTGVVLLRGQKDAAVPELVLETLVKAPAKLTGIERYKAITIELMEMLEAHKPDRIVIEGYSLNMKNASSVVPLVELGGLIRFMMHLDGYKWLDPRATELKKFVTGKGNAPKEAMMMHVLKRWGHEAKNNDTADAYGLACMGLLHVGALGNSTQDQREIIGAVPLKCN
ncbi:ruvC-like resolvase [Rhodobacter phage RcZahn]|nr:ruvC-like resolvase [Rhodobacter phage RcZahn]